MPLPWIAPKQRSLTMWAVVAISLLSAGCHHWRGRCYNCLSNPYVCPSCDAKTVDQCRCFPASQSAGYHETTWAPLPSPYDPTHYQLEQPREDAYEIEYSESIEKLAPPAQSAEDGGTSVLQRDDAVIQATALVHAALDAVQREHALVSHADVVTESKSKTDTGPEDAPPVDDDYQPLSEYFRSAP